MITPLAVYATLFLNAVATVCCAALCMLVLWQDARRAGNQLTALTLACFSFYNATNLVFHFSYPFGVSPATFLRISIVIYGWSICSLFAAAACLVRVDCRVRMLSTLSGLGLAAFVTVTVWAGLAFQNIFLQSDQSPKYDNTVIGLALFVALLIYEAVGIMLVWRVRNDLSRGLWPVLISIPLATVLNMLPNFHAWPHDALIMVIVGLVLARLIMHEHVYKPMQELNRKLAQTNTALEQANLIKSQFLANMSHELRTPLNSVIGYTDLIVSGIYGPLNDKQEDRLNKIGRNGRLLLALINDVLDLSKIEAGRLSLMREPTSLPHLLDPILKALRPLAEEKGLVFRCDYPQNLPPLLIDRLRAEQILRNVINNAIRFTSRGSVVIGFEPADDELIIHVRDTGDGIPVKQQPHIFSSTATTLSATTSPENRQLGLTLSRHLVQLHGGRIWFTSEGIPGQGTVFSITFPLVLPVAAQINLTEGQSRGTVLCIDDSGETLEVLQGMLESAGYQVDCALDDRAAWQRIRERIPDVILLDILMPGIDGWQILQKLRTDPKTAAVPVIVISGIDQRTRAQQAGAQSSLAKPLRRADLLESVRLAQQRPISNRSAAMP